MFLRIVIVLLLNMFFSMQVSAEIKRIAVLEFRGVGVDKMMLLKLSDQARRAAVDTLSQDEYLIMTRENMMQVLADMGKDASCIEGSCEVEIGRNIGADLIITGDILLIEDFYVLTLKLYETRNGGLLEVKEVEQEKLLALKDGAHVQSMRLIEEGLSLEQPASGSSAVPKRASPKGKVSKDVSPEKTDTIQRKSSGQGSVALDNDPVIFGALDKSLIRAVLADNSDSLLVCYEDGLQQNVDLKGEIRIKFVISGNGSVSKAKVKSSDLNAELVEDCIAEQFKNLKFPKPKGGGQVIVTYPLLFSKR